MKVLEAGVNAGAAEVGEGQHRVFGGPWPIALCLVFGGFIKILSQFPTYKCTKL